MDARHPARSGYAHGLGDRVPAGGRVQVVRAANGWPVHIDCVDVPVVAPSWGVAAFATFMAAWGWRSR
jgi:hypothetical protein